MTKKFEKKYISNPDLLPEIEEYILNTIKEVPLDDEKNNNVELAVAEAAANGILHGNKSDPEKYLHVTIIWENNKLSISFSDEGKGFNPDEVPDPTTPENILRGSGRGLHIMRSLVDDLTYNFSEKGTKLNLIFYI